MLDIKFIREHIDEVREGLRKKQSDVDLDRLLALDEKRRVLIQKSEALKAEQNRADKEIARENDRDAKKIMIEKMRALKDEVQHSEFEARAVEEEFANLMTRVPNLPLADVPVGKDASENQVIRQRGEVPQFRFTPLDHAAIGKNLDLIDIERASHVSGSRFGYFKREAVLLEFALVHFTFRALTDRDTMRTIADSVEKNYAASPFIPVVPPVMIKPDVFTRMARLSEQDKDERYYLPKDDLYLVGSAEHTLGPLHMDEIINEQDLPIRYLGFSTSFRREAGSYGQDTKGVLRMHQFDKLEMESFSMPEQSVREQEFFVAVQEYLLQALAIPYQVVMICTGDMGGPDARQIDIECWMPGQKKYRETHTADLMTDYQARRLNTRVRKKDGTTAFAHMNDGTAFAIGRTLIAILENYQQEDGSVRVPEALQQYIGMKEIRR